MKSDEVLCVKCAEPIKAAAIKCKHCGHEYSKEDMLARVKAKGEAEGHILGGCLVLVAIIFLLAMCGRSNKPEDDAKAAADKEAGFHCLSEWDGSHRQFVDKVKSQLRDPDSFEHDETRVGPNVNGRHSITMRFGARNGFGGMNRSVAIGTYDHETCAPSEPIISGQ